MNNQLDRIEKKIDELDSKLDQYAERLVRVETSAGWLRWGFAILISTIASIVTGIVKF